MNNKNIKGMAKGNRTVYLYNKVETNKYWKKYKDIINNHLLIKKVSNIVNKNSLTKDKLNRS